MSLPSSAEDVVRAIYADVTRNDLAAVAGRLAAGFVAEQAAPLPFAGVWHGADGFTAMGLAILSAFEGFEVEPVRYLACGSAMLVETAVSAPASGQRPALEQTMFEYRRVIDGRAVECRPFYTDPQSRGGECRIKERRRCLIWLNIPTVIPMPPYPATRAEC